MKEIILAGGCFWGVEAYFSKVKGVIETEVGYANGNVKNPTYQQVCNTYTGHAEVCRIKYDNEELGLEELLQRFFKIIDPIAINRQGPDIGHQYRSGIFYTDEGDQNTIIKVLNQQQERYSRKIVTEIEPLKAYYKAEEYHQKYLEKNPNGYCHISLDD
ncbi:peptide-methionine (S)-S-oxide reductase MsrA [Alkaliphilus peptidifermentans]|uniref:Peptide methionine sulfoxide reductase MsrA n=1 Tax=Alkaliphilus peptidifermentans DSM 18978 TaxID=1120976 RepID=A0A1G5FI91_9FIRM|nr:peptide-methionine (S)-S-oxide reductase MsrA [Alkaliphilus peptidifermentans]SCY38570.1 peptide-methionine (S)-S-oxide reductase [Alkaliphilus peptidifermentans DSM 18978]